MNVVDDLILENQKLVYFVAKKFVKRAKVLNVEFDDVVSEGEIGLIKAAKNFKPEYGVKFSTYAVPMIEGNIKRAFRDANPGLKIPRQIKELVLKIDGSESVEYLMKTFEVDKKTAEAVLDCKNNPFLASLDYVMSNGEDKDVTLADQIGEMDDYSDLDVEDFLIKLPEKLKTVVKLAMKDKSQAEIGTELGLSQVHISRLLKKIRELYQEYKTEGDKEMAAINIEEYKNFKDQGLSDKQIADKKGISPAYLSQLRKKWFSAPKEAPKAVETVAKTNTTKEDKTAEYNQLISALRNDLKEAHDQMDEKDELLRKLQEKIEKYEHINAACEDVESELDSVREENGILKKRVEELESAPLPVISPLQCDCEVKVHHLQEENQAMRQLLKLWM